MSHVGPVSPRTFLHCSQQQHVPPGRCFEDALLSVLLQLFAGFVFGVGMPLWEI